jgi:hypothetical protein
MDARLSARSAVSILVLAVGDLAAELSEPSKAKLDESLERLRDLVANDRFVSTAFERLIEQPQNIKRQDALEEAFEELAGKNSTVAAGLLEIVESAAEVMEEAGEDDYLGHADHYFGHAPHQLEPPTWDQPGWRVELGNPERQDP